MKKMRDVLKANFKWGDVVIVVLLLLLSFSPYIIQAVHYQNVETASENRIAIVTVDGEEVDRFELNTTTPHQEKTIHPHKGQYNIIELEGNRIRVKEDNSPDQIAVKTGWIDKTGQVLICLPHKLVIEIVNENKNSNEDDIIVPY